MADIVTISQHGRSLPAEFKVSGKNGGLRLMTNGMPVQSRSAHGMGDVWTDMTGLLNASAGMILPIIATQNDGTVLQKNADGTLTVYRQPTGSQTNLPVMISSNGSVYNPSAGANASVNTPVGSLGIQNLKTQDIVLLGGGVLLLIMLLSHK